MKMVRTEVKRRYAKCSTNVVKLMLSYWSNGRTVAMVAYKHLTGLKDACTHMLLTNNRISYSFANSTTAKATPTPSFSAWHQLSISLQLQLLLACLPQLNRLHAL
jgi:hypothetical protein